MLEEVADVGRTGGNGLFGVVEDLGRKIQSRVEVRIILCLDKDMQRRIAREAVGLETLDVLFDLFDGSFDAGPSSDGLDAVVDGELLFRDLCQGQDVSKELGRQLGDRLSPGLQRFECRVVPERKVDHRLGIICSSAITRDQGDLG